MDVFSERGYAPMLIAREVDPFDDADWTFELKLDGIRCLAYLDETGTDLINKRGLKHLPKFPELDGLHRQVQKPCVLDGELIVFHDGEPVFEDVKNRALTGRRDKIAREARLRPATFVAYDLLYLDGEDLCGLPFEKRRKLLEETVTENERLALTRTVPERGVEFFSIARERGLEGIVGKRNASIYRPGARTRDWVKIKNLLDDDFVVCGYILKDNGVTSIVLGQYSDADELVYKGHVTMGVSRADFEAIKSLGRWPSSPFMEPIPASNDDAIWVEPSLVCRVEFMSRNESGLMRQPVYRGLRIDKGPLEAREPKALEGGCK